ncbi:MAG: cobalamin biosynthesis protein CbiX [Variovorax sp.]|nr:cobalamin biosynthesis protein CbiX [Variovorax sp.]
MRGVILFAHGSRDPRWREPIDAVARRMGELDTGVPVGCAYLELMSPDLRTATQALVQRGVASIRIVPLFLGVGRHAREDLPRLVEELRAAHPGIAFSVTAAVGEEPEVIDLLAGLALRPGITSKP